jgi:hypothetical protein
MATDPPQLSLLAIDTNETHDKATPGASRPPLFLIQEDDLWRELCSEPLVEPFSKSFTTPTPTPQEIKTYIDATLRDTLETKEFVPETLANLAKLGKTIFQALLPRKLRARIRTTPTSSEEFPSKLPILKVYTHSAEWIPWELMHDGTDFLGLRYQIARLPILMALDTACRRKTDVVVTTATSFLAAGLLKESDEGYKEWLDKWQDTFSFLTATGKISETRYPDNNANPKRNYPLVRDVLPVIAAHEGIIHFTCHGILDGEESRNFTWTLKEEYSEDQRYIYRILATDLNWLDEGVEVPDEPTRPLVFGNACGSAGQGVLGQDFGSQLIDSYGAAAYVGAFAKVSKSLAVDFAHRFYRNLLCEDLTIGEALWKTKSDYKKGGEKDPSWLFYYLWGLPDTRFRCLPAK